MTGPRLGARLWWGLVPLALLLWATGALATAALPGIPTTPLVTLALVPGLDFAATIAAAVAVGALLVRLLTPAARVRAWAVGWSLSAAALCALGVIALGSELTSREPDGPGWLEVATQTLAGRALLVEAAGLVLAALVVAVSGGRRAGLVALVVAAAVVAAPGVAGHAGLSGPHAAAALAIGLHAVAASLWVGGLAVVVGLLVREPDRAPVLLPRYSIAALVCVLVLAESGLLTTSLTVGGILDLLGTTYGSLVLAKAALLGWLVLLGWRQRRQALDRLPDASVPRTVVSIAAAEFLLMGTALATATVLARIGPSPVPGGGIAPLTLVVLGLAVPMLVVTVRPRGWRATDAVPEVAVVVLLIVMVEVGGVGLLRVTLGPVGLVLELALLIGAGWLAVAAVGRGGLVVLAAGLPVALVAAAILADRPGTWGMALIAVVVAEALVVLWWRRLARVGPAVPDTVLAGSSL